MVKPRSLICAAFFYSIGSSLSLFFIKDALQLSDSVSSLKIRSMAARFFASW
ncbi:hypothetical protein GYO_1032 [Bacillus spizizenii TU-B-10]|jgi:hypothetical protein|uniref:Uncharacterized protein n=1 Tax=Bacillus spizizenii (strain DSM 15029 / JCM 12233 / NBRC 101239 / NRRL B-23049 / TU-B-10) TaxID=1052585 RepID=G4NUC5_BACS4|nr:hypothetical protein GYO_1032 [Bacillus spizizenii TU-B-10]